MSKKKFPTFWFLVLIFAIVLLLKDLGILTINFPWIAVILIVIALGAIINNYSK